MKTIIKIGGVLAVITLLFVLYPYYVQYSEQYLNIANLIYSSTGGTMTTIESIFFSALPLIGLILILWIGWRMITSRWGR